MEQRLAELSRRRAELVARSAAQRGELGMACAPWRLPLAVADRGIAAWHFVRAHPALLAGLAVGFAVARPRRAISWLRRGWALWRMYRNLTASGRLD